MLSPDNKKSSDDMDSIVMDSNVYEGITYFVDTSMAFDRDFDLQLSSNVNSIEFIQTHNLNFIQDMLKNSLVLLVKYAGSQYCMNSQPEQNIASQLLYKRR